MAEKVITCPVCFDNDHCFEEVQDEWSSYICFRCGYTSNSMGDLGIVYPEGTKTSWTYKLAQPRPLTKEEKKDEKYKGHDRMLDVDNAKEFGQYEFLEALKLMGVVKDL